MFLLVEKMPSVQILNSELPAVVSLLAELVVDFRPSGFEPPTGSHSSAVRLERSSLAVEGAALSGAAYVARFE